MSYKKEGQNNAKKKAKKKKEERSLRYLVPQVIGATKCPPASIYNLPKKENEIDSTKNTKRVREITLNNSSGDANENKEKPTSFSSTQDSSKADVLLEEFKKMKEEEESKLEKKIFFIRKNTVQDPLRSIHDELSQHSFSLLGASMDSCAINNFFLNYWTDLRFTSLGSSIQNRRDIFDKVSRMSEFAMNGYKKVQKILEQIKNLLISVETKKRYNNTTHFHPGIYLSRDSVNGYTTIHDESDESVGSDDDNDEKDYINKKERCSRCGDRTDGEIRYLRISCFYNMKEINIKELKHDKEHQSYVIGVCKDCRHKFMFDFLPKWFYDTKQDDVRMVQNRAVQPEEMDSFLKAFSNIDTQN